MNNKLFQNDNITGNSTIGFEIKGVFKDEENILMEKIKEVLNRNITYSNNYYKLLEPTDTNAVVMQEGSITIIKTPMYSYFEAIFIMPKILDFLKTLKSYKGSHLYIKIGFNKDFVDITQVNVLKFIFEYNEDFILKSLTDITKNSNIDKITELKPSNIYHCSELIQKQVDGYKYVSPEDDNFGLSFTNLNMGYILFKYTQGINYRDKWENILKCINHTIITLYNTSKNTNLDDEEKDKLEKLNQTFQDYATAFGCYEMFNNKYKSIKLTVDLNNDKSIINMVFTSLRDQLFNIIIYNNIKSASINYDTDVSRLQIKDIDIKNSYDLKHIDIVNCDIEDSCIKDCDIYDSNIKNSTVIRSNLFGYANCSDSNFDDCFISRNITLKNCDVYGQLGKMGGTMDGGSLKNTTIMTSMCDIHDNVEKDNVNKIE
ncbi:MAG: hypothetical protein NC548_30990 [Lachnospiraceae bacterium]|nr:hypothetical protein [Lachnospiraceae bacterium]